jgi:methylenetetrahydrofolate reductase (NADPH)
MKINHTFNISFEFFPPKSIEGVNNLSQVALNLSKFAPSFFSVTYGACGTTHDGTIDTVKILQKNTPVPLSPHLSCIGATREKILEILSLYKSLGITRLVAIRGDLLPGMENTSELQYANELVSYIREITEDHFYIAVAAYPECHPQAASLKHDLLCLKKKVAAGADSAITQYFFNPDAYFYFLDECAKQGIFVPIVPGIMPITNFAKLVRFSNSCGAEIPRWIYKRLETYGADESALKAFGTELVYNLCEQLIAGGAPGLHFYTLNQAETVSILVNMLGISPQLELASGTQVL